MSRNSNVGINEMIFGFVVGVMLLFIIMTAWEKVDPENFGPYQRGYREGQINYVNGIIKYELKKDKDGQIIWSKIGAPQPIMDKLQYKASNGENWVPPNPPGFNDKRMYLNDKKSYTMTIDKHSIRLYEGEGINPTKLKYKRDIGQVRLYWCKGEGDHKWYCYIEP